MFRVFDKLKNGALVLMCSDDVVLCAWNDEYVTWRVDRDGFCYWGTYHAHDLIAAIEKFNKRSIG